MAILFQLLFWAVGRGYNLYGLLAPVALSGAVLWLTRKSPKDNSTTITVDDSGVAIRHGGQITNYAWSEISGLKRIEGGRRALIGLKIVRMGEYASNDSFGAISADIGIDLYRLEAAIRDGLQAWRTSHADGDAHERSSP